jgi:hypothetical protein
MKQLVAGFAVAATFAVSASAMAGAPVRLTDAQMDQVVAGTIYTDRITSVDVTMEYYHGYSNNVAPGPGPGTSSAAVTTTTLWERTLDCTGGNINSCYNGPPPEQNAKPGVVQSQVQISVGIDKGPLLSGPGGSFNNRF